MCILFARQTELSRQRNSVSQNQISQSKHNVEFRGLFGETAIARSSKAKLPFYDRKKRVLLLLLLMIFCVPLFSPHIVRSATIS